MKKQKQLPEYLREHFAEFRPNILARLEDFSRVPTEEYFYELCYCLLTPQSKAKNAERVIAILKARNFQEKPFDTSELLRQNIRFHNVKARRLLKIHGQFSGIMALINSAKGSGSGVDIRKTLVEKIDGFGWKEASHFLRNIGFRNLGILDRHILKHLVRCGVFSEIPAISSAKQYADMERKYRDFADAVGISMDEIDLLFWSFETGEILK